ncbi:MAG: hypothetical protein C0605_07370 [Hyphomicrobiales bacterium]|nr:MAG: hypothetical protein C0605_07370 [Hyphomicrobiales bacterium]
MLNLFPKSCSACLGALFVASLLMMTPQAARAGSCASAKSYVSGVANSVTRTVANTGVGSRAREARFTRIFHSSMDIRRLGKFALGRYARKIPASQNGTYLKLLEQLVIKVFFGRLKNYRGEKYKIFETARGCRAKGGRGSEFVVSGQIVSASGRPMVQVDWWLVSGGRRVFDIAVEGVWLAQQQRSAFNAVLSKSGGDFNALFTNLRGRIGRGR